MSHACLLIHGLISEHYSGMLDDTSAVKIKEDVKFSNKWMEPLSTEFYLILCST